MKIKGIILLSSFITAAVLISGGYGYWEKKITIKGDITIVKPDSIMNMPEPGDPLQTNTQPMDNAVGEDVNPNQSEEQLPDAPGNTETNLKEEPEKLEEEKETILEPTEQIEESNQLENPSEPKVSSEQTKTNEPNIEDKVPLNEDNESSNMGM